MNSITTFLAAAVVAGTPLLFATLGEILTEKVGNLNLGVEGMMLMGSVIGFMAGLSTGSPIIAMLAAAIAGGFGALIYAFLTITLRANQVVCGLTLTIFGTGFSSMVGKKLIGQVTPDKIKTFFVPKRIPLIGDIPFIGDIFFNQDVFVYLGYIITLLLFIYLYKTAKGLNTMAVGENPAAADAASINVNLYKYVNTLIGGALCGLGGAYLSLVYVPAWQENVTAGRGWIAVALVIFATWRPHRALIGAYLFGGLDILGFRLQGLPNFAVNQYLIDLLPYIATIIILVIVSMRKSSKNSPPAGLSNAYFREER